MKKSTIDAAISQEQAKLNTLTEKKSAIEEKMKKCRAEIARLRLLYRNSQFDDLTEALSNKGLSVDDVLAALSSGDLSPLAELLDGCERPHGEDDEQI